VAASGSRFTTARLQPLFVLLVAYCLPPACGGIVAVVAPWREGQLSPSIFQEERMDPDPEPVSLFTDVNTDFTFTLFRPRTGGMSALLS
jgi:hypothetical protein